MILIITLVLSILVTINFLLLAFSCNKTTKKIVTDEKAIMKPIKSKEEKIPSSQLAPTGS